MQMELLSQRKQKLHILVNIQIWGIFPNIICWFNFWVLMLLTCVCLEQDHVESHLNCLLSSCQVEFVEIPWIINRNLIMQFNRGGLSQEVTFFIIYFFNFLLYTIFLWHQSILISQCQGILCTHFVKENHRWMKTQTKRGLHIALRCPRCTLLKTLQNSFKNFVVLLSFREHQGVKRKSLKPF